MVLKRIDISKWDNSWLRKLRGGGSAPEPPEEPPVSPEKPEAPPPPPAAPEGS